MNEVCKKKGIKITSRQVKTRQRKQVMCEGRRRAWLIMVVKAHPRNTRICPLHLCPIQLNAHAALERCKSERLYYCFNSTRGKKRKNIRARWIERKVVLFWEKWVQPGRKTGETRESISLRLRGVVFLPRLTGSIFLLHLDKLFLSVFRTSSHLFFFFFFLARPNRLLVLLKKILGEILCTWCDDVF